MIKLINAIIISAAIYSLVSWGNVDIYREDNIIYIKQEQDGLWRVITIEEYDRLSKCVYINTQCKKFIHNKVSK